MLAREINQNALNLLERQQWFAAQKLFFLNAKKFPSHNSYNNLGVFLVTEGLTCKNGRTRNVYKLGLKYLLRASSISETQINLCAIAKAYDYALRYCSNEKRAELLNCSSRVLSKALKISYDYEIHYNLLRVMCLQTYDTIDLLDEVRTLANVSRSKEIVGLYFELLRKHHLQDEGLESINNFSDYLDEVELLMFYTSLQMFDKGYGLCKRILEEYSPDKFIASAILECCLNTHHFYEAELYAKKIKEMNDSIKYQGKEKWDKDVLKNLHSTSEYRRTIIANYSNIPPNIDQCCYFGCSIHGTTW